MRINFRWAVAGLAILLGLSAAQADTLQGFEANTGDWTLATQVASGTHGITSKTGGFHAEADNGSFEVGGSAYTFFDNTLANVPPGFTTSVDIFLDLNTGASNDTRLDWDVALQKSGGAFLRDFIFNGGFYDDSDSTGTGARFVFTAGNNAGRANAFPKNPGNDPFAITTSGWYTFQHHFQDDNGELRVDMSILDANGNVLNTWTLNSGDSVGADCCSDYYGWFSTQEFDFLAFDNVGITQDSIPTQVPEPASMSLLAIGLAGGWARRRGRKA